MKKRIINMFILIILLFNCTLISNASMPLENFHQIEALTLPEKDINLQVNNLTRGSEVYLLFPTELLKYNMQKFIQNNIVNEFETEQEIADDLQKLLDKEDYLGYIEYFSNDKYDVASNAIEFRQYCVAIGQNKAVDYFEYENKKYVKFEINLNENGQYKVILKDYFLDTDCSGIKFMIDEFNTVRYINVSDYQMTTNPDKTAISEYNITIDYVTKEDYNQIELSIKVAYYIIGIIIILTVLLILLHELKKYKKKKEEKKEALFYKHDEEKKKFFERIKEKKNNKKNKKK